MKTKLITAALSATLLVSGTALALDMDPKFYVGGEVQGHQYKSAKQIKDKNGNVILDSKDFNNKSFLKKSGSSGSLFFGSKLTENFGLEAGYTGFSKNKHTLEGTIGANKHSLKLETKNQNLYLDALGYLPVADNVDLIGSAGIGRLTSKVTANDTITPVAGGANTVVKTTGKSHKAGVRVGLGAQYKFNANMGARLMVRHQKGNQLVKSVNSAGLGLFYEF